VFGWQSGPYNVHAFGLGFGFGFGFAGFLGVPHVMSRMAFEVVGDESEEGGRFDGGVGVELFGHVSEGLDLDFDGESGDQVIGVVHSGLSPVMSAYQRMSR